MCLNFDRAGASVRVYQHSVSFYYWNFSSEMMNFLFYLNRSVFWQWLQSWLALAFSFGIHAYFWHWINGTRTFRTNYVIKTKFNLSLWWKFRINLNYSNTVPLEIVHLLLNSRGILMTSVIYGGFNVVNVIDKLMESLYLSHGLTGRIQEQ